MATSVKQLLEAANAVVPKVTPAQAREMMAKGNTLVVDVRDAPELEKSGKVAGAVHHSRGMLEFRADPESLYYDPEFRQGQDHPRLLRFRRSLCACWQGAQRYGLWPSYNMGAFKDWVESGGAVEKPIDMGMS